MPLTPTLSLSDAEREKPEPGSLARRSTTRGLLGKSATQRVLAMTSAAVLVAASGCGTAQKQTESLLRQSGFNSVPATTPFQKEELAKLPEGKISKVAQQQKIYYVYPDRSHKLLYVGREEQYQLYQRILQDEQGFNQDKQAFQDTRALKDAEEGRMNGWDLEW